MKLKTTHYLFFILILINYNLANCQDFNLKPQGGEYKFNSEKTACLSSIQRSAIISELKANKKMLEASNKLAYAKVKVPNPLFIWPIKKSATNTYNDVWSISGYADHDIGFSNQLQDYNCLTKTYDTNNYNHQGVDIYTWPFAWKMMDDDAVEIIAASSGQIIDKRDGEFDRSCAFNNNIWNAVYIQHNDGSVAWYGHMKNGSVTTKAIGEMVAQGEYLGVLGSSGNSTGPHLHFEVWEDDSYTKLIDPYAGPCNGWNTESWWQNQKPYNNPGINAVLTHSQVPNIFPSCPTTETPYISNAFETSDTIYFAIYVRDQTANDNISLEIIRPDDSSLFGNWNLSVQTTATSWYYYWSYSGYFDMVGEWKWQATFGGETITNTFNVSNTLSVEDSNIENTSVYPNPVNDELFIKSTNIITDAIVTDLLGKTILKLTNKGSGIKIINTELLNNGMYFITLSDIDNRKKTIKILKD